MTKGLEKKKERMRTEGRRRKEIRGSSGEGEGMRKQMTELKQRKRRGG